MRDDARMNETFPSHSFVVRPGPNGEPTSRTGDEIVEYPYPRVELVGSVSNRVAELWIGAGDWTGLWGEVPLFTRGIFAFASGRLRAPLSVHAGSLYGTMDGRSCDGRRD